MDHDELHAEMTMKPQRVRRLMKKSYTWFNGLTANGYLLII